MAEFFPQEIIVEILSRTAVKPLCRFKCVSKPWLMLITDPKFIQAHTAKTRHHQTLILANHPLFSVSLEPFEQKGSSFCDLEALEIDFPLKSNSRNEWVRICGSCNGFICILPVRPVVFIFNPCIGKFKKVPQCVFVTYCDVYGFGYAPTIDDYKLIKIGVCFMVAVYSLKTNKWKEVESFPHSAPPYEPGASVNGAVHWVVRRRRRDGREGGPWVIAAFDLVEECFKEVDVPDEVLKGYDFKAKRLSIGALDGCLCLSHCSNDVLSNDFWIMRDYGVKESWCKVEMKNVSYKLGMKPMCLMKKGEALLMIDYEKFVLCNLEDGKCADFVVRGSPLRYDANVCVETLVSPNLIKGFRVASDLVSSVSKLRV